MMQTGMVKQSVDYTTSIKALDGTKINYPNLTKIERKIRDKIKLLKSNSYFWAAHIFE